MRSTQSTDHDTRRTRRMLLVQEGKIPLEKNQGLAVCLTDALCCSCYSNRLQSLRTRVPPAKPIPCVRNSHFAVDLASCTLEDPYHILPCIVVFVYLSVSYSACKHLDCSVFTLEGISYMCTSTSSVVSLDPHNTSREVLSICWRQIWRFRVVK